MWSAVTADFASTDGWRNVAGAMSVLAEGGALRHAAAMAGMEPERAGVVAGQLVRAAILRDEDPVRFVHPIVRRVLADQLTSVARDDLHPALSDLLIRAAREIHGTPGMFRTAGEYPAPLARDFRISDDAERYYKSGEQFLYKRLPFWLARMP